MAFDSFDQSSHILTEFRHLNNSADRVIVKQTRYLRVLPAEGQLVSFDLLTNFQVVAVVWDYSQTSYATAVVMLKTPGA